MSNRFRFCPLKSKNSTQRGTKNQPLYLLSPYKSQNRDTSHFTPTRKSAANYFLNPTFLSVTRFVLRLPNFKADDAPASIEKNFLSFQSYKAIIKKSIINSSSTYFIIIADAFIIFTARTYTSTHT